MAETVVARRDEPLTAAAGTVSTLFERLLEQLARWRDALVADQGAGAMSASALDDRVERLVVPALRENDPVLVGAGFVAAPEFTGGDDLHFAWWLGPLDDNPLTGATTEPTRLDLASRSYSDYLRDFPTLEWYSVPRSTHGTHITGPYVDHLCACDYIVTVTSPVEREGRMLGVVGIDIYVRRLERELLPAMRAVGRPVILANEWGRVMVSTDPSVLVGAVFDGVEGRCEGEVRCVGTPFRLLGSAQAD